MAEASPLYVTWMARDPKSGKLIEVDIFKFIARSANIVTEIWNRVGLGSILFKSGSLKIIDLETGKTTMGSNNYRAMFFSINLRRLQEATDRTEDAIAGFERLHAIVTDRREMVRLELKAYEYMLGLLRDYFAREGALNMVNEYSAKPYEPSHSGKKKTFRPFMGSKASGLYTSKWNELKDIIFGNPKVVGDTLESFTRDDLLTVQLPSQRSPLKSIFMMEEFGTGLEADPGMRRPYLGSSTPFKVPPKIANQFGFADAIYMWWPGFMFHGVLNFIQKAGFMQFGLMKGSSATRWIKELKNTHAPKMSLNEYRAKAFASIKKYKEEGSFTNPLNWAYGQKHGATPGHPGRRARHLFFNRGGLVEEIRIIQVRGYKRLLQLVDAEIAKTVEGFASVADTVFPIDPSLGLG